MGDNVQSSEVSLEILVHTSAPTTNGQDAIYRKQGAALLAYMDRGMRHLNASDKSSGSSLAMQQTPMAPEILVPKTMSNAKSKAVQDTGPHLAIAESILVSADSVPDGLLRYRIEHAAHGTSKRSLTSITSSTASIVEVNSTPQPKHKLRDRERTPRTTGNTSDTHQNGATTFDANPSIGSLVSPDSFKFKLQSPNGYLVRKRELNPPAEEARPVPSHAVLAELSPNKRRKPSVAMDVPKSQNSLPLAGSENSGCRLHPEGWLSSIAQLTSSSSSESMPRPLPSAETVSSKPEDVFLAPWPSSGHEPYISHLVGTLALVAGIERLCAAYRPKEIRRKIEPLERGYWHLRIPYSWSSADQESFWKMLEEMIVEGKCGWGIWVEHILDPLDKAGSMEASRGSQQDVMQKHVSEIKVWCWGEVVREIWLSLLMASRRQTLRLGMTWHDSCGDIVIQMK